MKPFTKMRFRFLISLKKTFLVKYEKTCYKYKGDLNASKATEGVAGKATCKRGSYYIKLWKG